MISGSLRLNRRVLAATALLALGVTQTTAQITNQGGRSGTGGPTSSSGGGFSGSGSGGGTRSYQNTTMVGDAVITSDVDTRRLIVVTDETTNENIKKIIESLDKPKPQVLINVVFLQVTHNGTLDLGAEASYQGPISIKTNPEGIASTNFGIEAQRRNDSTFYGGFYRLLGRDVNATIHALSGVSKTEILSRPSILTRSNQQATILVGQSIPLLDTTVQNTNSNSVTSTVNYRDVGIILRVTPFITAEGQVEMIVSPEISSLSATTVAIPGSGGSAPVIDRRSADTVVVTPSDRTIVIGGLISNQKNDTDTKVPVLGDIPILGNAFKRKKKEDTKTELLIFLTPHVVSKPEDLATVSERERSNLKMAPTSFDQADLSKFISPAKN